MILHMKDARVLVKGSRKDGDKHMTLNVYKDQGRLCCVVASRHVRIYLDRGKNMYCYHPLVFSYV